MDIEFIREKIRRKEYVIDPDHLFILRKRSINIRDIEHVILTGEIIETWPGDLTLGFIGDNIPLHVACSYWAEEKVTYIHTAYIPDSRLPTSATALPYRSRMSLPGYALTAASASSLAKSPPRLMTYLT